MKTNQKSLDKGNGIKVDNIYCSIKVDDKEKFKSIKIYFGTIGSYKKFIEFNPKNMILNHSPQYLETSYETGHIKLKDLTVNQEK